MDGSRHHPPAGPGGPRESPGPPGAGRRARDTRQRIVEAGHACVREVGIRRLTMESVAERAAVSRAALYRHFPNKAALVDEVLEANARRLRRRLEELLEDKTTLADKVGAAARFGQFPPRDVLLLGLSETDPVSLAVLLTADSQRSVERAIRFWEPHVEEARRAGEVAEDIEAGQAAEWIARAFFSLATVPAVTFDVADPEAFEAYARTFVLRGVLGAGPHLVR